MNLQERIEFLEALVDAYQDITEKLLDTIRKLKELKALPTSDDLDADAAEKLAAKRTSHAS